MNIIFAFRIKQCFKYESNVRGKHEKITRGKKENGGVESE